MKEQEFTYEEMITEVINKLVGHTNSIAETNYDNEAQKNINIKINVIYSMILDLMRNTKEKNSPYYSVKRNAEYCIKLLDKLQKGIYDFLSTNEINDELFL